MFAGIAGLPFGASTTAWPNTVWPRRSRHLDPGVGGIAGTSRIAKIVRAPPHSYDAGHRASQPAVVTVVSGWEARFVWHASEGACAGGVVH